MSTIPWKRFARFSVETGDIDPMYELIYKGRMKYGKEWANRYALFFFMFYDAGDAATAAEAENFWEFVTYGYEHFKRGTERRHFRGDKGLNAIRNLQKKGNPEVIWNLMWGRSWGHSLSILRLNVNTYFKGCEIGPYFIWKAMDILDRGLGLPVACSADEAVENMPSEPREAAQFFFPEHNLYEAMDLILEEIYDMKAPGDPSRNCSYPEVETILCMMKGYFRTKKHVIGDDVDEKHQQLEIAGHSHLRALLPPQLIWRSYERAMESKTLPDNSSGVRPEEQVRGTDVGPGTGEDLDVPGSDRHS